ncbi:Alpha/Beta hydrolase protein [Aspergillus venezuelensis]
MTQWTFSPSQPGAVRNIASWTVSAGQIKEAPTYQIDVSWPLTWSGKNPVAEASIVYLVDGNALFLTATEALRRRASHRPNEISTVVVGIGYRLTDSVFSPRRSYDLTPPCERYTPPDGPDGKPKSEARGGADEFLTFIAEVVRPFIEKRVFPGISFGRRALFGHSYGGLFVLHTLFTRPKSFDVYLAASPSIWWNERFIMTKAEDYISSTSPTTAKGPVLRLCYGSREQYPIREPGEPMEKFERRKEGASRRRMTDNCKEIYTRLQESDRLSTLEMREYSDEDHGSVIAPALTGALTFLSTPNVTTKYIHLTIN